MSVEKVLTKEIAEQFLTDEESVDLSEFTAIEDDAAKSLSKHQGYLDFSSLMNASDAAAEILSKRKIACKICGTSTVIFVDPIAYKKWITGDLIQDAMPDLSASDREMLKSHTCNECYESFWDEEDDFDDVKDMSNEDDLASFGNSESIVAFLKRKNTDSETGDWLKDPQGTLVNTIGMKLVPIEPGEFQMGEPDCDEGENLCHPVQITNGFYIGMFAVTQGEYFAVTGKNPSYFLGKNRPVDQLSWEDAKEFCNLLSQLPEEVAAGRLYRLPTEAEWEYACRAGMETDFCFGDSVEPDKANHSDHGGQMSPQPTLPVGSFWPNKWGLYDTHGNVWEWCSDWFDEEYYQDSPPENPAGPYNGDHHTLRGGAASNAGYECSSYMRGEASACDGPSPEVPAYGRFEALGDFGVRVVCEIDD